MWLPTPLYERVPQFWLLLGLLFMISGLYLGIEYNMAFLYVGVGAACVVWGAAVVSWRRRFRSMPISRTSTLAADGLPGQDNAEDIVEKPGDN